MALHHVDARGRRRPTFFACLLLGLALFTLASGAGLAVTRFDTDLAPVGDAPAQTMAAGSPATPMAWAVHLAQAPDGHLYYAVDPPSVADRVKDDFLQAWNWYYAADGMPDPAQAGQYFAGGYLQAVEHGLRYYAEQGHYAYWEVRQVEWLGNVEFSADGSRATVSARLVGPIEIYEMDANQPGVRLQMVRREQWTTKTSLAWDARQARWLAFDEVSGVAVPGN